VEIETSNLVNRLMVASEWQSWQTLNGKPSLKGASLGHVNHLNFGGHQPSL